MAALRFSGWQHSHIGRLLVTISLDPPTTSRNLHQHRRWEAATEQLIHRMTGHSLPATWGLCDPAQSAATKSILAAIEASGVAHEIAVLGDNAWIGARAGRPRFSKELVRRFEQARAKGIAATTLLYRGDGPGEHLDLLIKHNVSAICPVDPDVTRMLPNVLPKALRYSLWELRGTGMLPGANSWFAGHRIMRRIRRAAHEGSTFNLLVDAPALQQQGPRAEDRLARVIQQVALLRDRGLLEAETMAAAAARLSEVPAAIPQRSILRVAG